MKRQQYTFMTFAFIAFTFFSCHKSTAAEPKIIEANKVVLTDTIFKTGADDYKTYNPVLRGFKNVAVVANQSSMVNYAPNLKDDSSYYTAAPTSSIHLVDFLIANDVKLTKIMAPEHGFRGTADAGEHINDSKDSKTGLPILSLYGANKKPSAAQLKDVDCVVFDLQDVGVRFYTYISTLHYIMESCAENNIKLIVLDRPNPNGNIVDGPVLDMQYKSFVGMHPVPVLHGMTMGEYAKMINGEKWLANGVQCDLSVVPCLAYTKDMFYDLPVKPSPNLPNAKAINLYASLCLFEGTNVSVGRGTDKQFQVYGSPYMSKSSHSFTPVPNEGAKDPVHNGKLCYGEDLSKRPNVKQLELMWLMKAYLKTKNKSRFFNSFFTKLAGSPKLQQQIISGMTEDDIRTTWETDLFNYKKMRTPYLIYNY